jgi:hypothetical protein
LENVLPLVLAEHIQLLELVLILEHVQPVTSHVKLAMDPMMIIVSHVIPDLSLKTTKLA